MPNVSTDAAAGTANSARNSARNSATNSARNSARNSATNSARNSATNSARNSATNSATDPAVGAAGRLTATEVAELLGVKRQTVYAYVSRGILDRVVDLDGRTSLFDRSEVERLRHGRRPDREGETRMMVTTRLTRVSDEGLWVRGRDLIELTSRGAGFADVVDLLWNSPDEHSWRRMLRDSVDGPRDVGPGRPDMPLLDQLRVVVALESAADPLRNNLSDRSVRAVGQRLLTAMVLGLTTDSTGADDRAFETDTGIRPALSPAVGLWQRLAGTEPTEPRLRALDLALALLADHGLATSTFAARVAASVRADPYSVVGAGLGALGGPLHGAASMAVHRLYGSAAASEADPASVIGEILEPDRLPPGFGHSVYQSQDPRYGALMAQVVIGWRDDPRLQTVFRVRDVIAERSDAMANVDLALGALTYLADMPLDAGEAIFAVARTAGWLAHAMEEYGEQPLRFRPRAAYRGERVE